MSGEGWYTRVLPVTGLVTGLVVLLALLVPGVRTQLMLSTTATPQEYVALSFARDDAGRVAVCARDRARVRVDLAVTSTYRETRTLRYVIRVGDVRRAGRVEVEPQQTVVVTRSAPRPTGDRFDLEAAIPAEDRVVFAHCPGGDR